jgi:uncharacterized membrane protein YkvA (DUF1232 family)
MRPAAIARFFGDRRASLSAKLLVAAAIAYVLMPIDLVPDFAPVIGWLDDIGAATAALGWIAHRISVHEQKIAVDAGPVIDVGG